MRLIHLTAIIFLAYLNGYSGITGIRGMVPQEKKKKSQLVETLTTNPDGKGQPLRIEFVKGKAHNHALYAIWAEDLEGNYIQTLYVSKSIATSIFNYGAANDGTWTDGVVRRPAALPYWSHKRGVQAEDGLYMPLPGDPVPDAYSGATPKNSFILQTRLDQPGPESFYILLEVNQPWDWNEYWTNNKFPDDEEYKTSSQPAVVYRALLKPGASGSDVVMEVIGHSHYAGKDGSLTQDVSTLTTALQIAEQIQVTMND
jgi:hypothetical protein